MRAFITGGAGFIGSNLADRLLEKKYEVVVFDDFSSGQMQCVEHNLKNPLYILTEGDVLDKADLSNAMRDCDIVFHFQANADVKGGMKNTNIDVEQNIIGTHNVLEAMKINDIKRIVFASSATVYGEPEQIPTPENIAPVQTSLYGASKYAAEALIQAYCEYFEIRCWIFRFVSFMGPRYSHGVIFDFLKKLKDDPSHLHILGNGTQRKSYLHVSDGINAILLALEKATEKINPNIARPTDQWQSGRHSTKQLDAAITQHAKDERTSRLDAASVRKLGRCVPIDRFVRDRQGPMAAEDTHRKRCHCRDARLDRPRKKRRGYPRGDL